MADLLSLTNELLLHIFQFLEPGKETQSLPVVCRRFLECVETPHLWRLLWLRWIASDAGLLEEAIKRAANGKAAAADPMDQETPSTDAAGAASAPATTGDVDASDSAPPAVEREITKKPVQRFICTDAMAYKANVWKHYAKAEAKFNAKVLADSGVEGCSFSLMCTFTQC